MSKPYVPKWSNVIPLWSDERHPVSVVNSETVPPETLKTNAPSVAKTSRGVNPAAADCDGAIAMYFSRQEPNPGSVANTEAVPSQATALMFSLQNSLTSKRSGTSGHARGKGDTRAKG